MVDKNFAYKVKGALQRLGYSYEYTRKGVTILKTPQTIEERIAEIAIRKFDLDVRADPVAFSTFLFLLQFHEGFSCAPWSTRERIIEKEFGITVTEQTMRKWAKRLMEYNLIVKDDSERQLWYTIVIDGIKVQDKATPDDMEQYQEYCKDRNEFLTIARLNGEKYPWKWVFHQLWSKYHVVYYYCKPFISNRLADDDIRELFALIENYYIFDEETNTYYCNDEQEELHLFI